MTETTDAPKFTRIVLLGPPGAGKTTQAELLAEQFNLPLLSMGEIFREHVRERTTLGEHIMKDMEKGDYASDEIANQVFSEHAEQLSGDSYVLDGYPRTAEQVKFLSESVTLNPDLVIVFDVDIDVARKRLQKRGKVGSGRRKDDSESVLKRRFELHYQNAPEVKAHYQNEGKLVTVDSSEGVLGTFQKVLRKVRGL